MGRSDGLLRHRLRRGTNKGGLNMFTQIKELRCAVAQITEALDALERQLATVTLARFQDCVSPDVPEGYDTVLGYLAKQHPEVLETFDYSDPQATVRDGWFLARLAGKRLHALLIYVTAPPVLQARGIDSVRAYPINLLARRFD
jgi:hypothetical protein